MVIGVYPSAFHVEWRAPKSVGVADDRRGGVKALAVDVEPTVFWNGDALDFERRKAAWMDAVGFIEGDKHGQHGHIARSSPTTNGSSGAKVEHLYLKPMQLDAARTAFTDIYPVFQIKQGSTEQGAAIRREYDAIASSLGMRACSLPNRLSAAKLPAEAARVFGGRIVADLVAAAPQVVIGLGEDVWETLQLLPTLHARSPVERFEEFYGDRYGQPGSLTIGGVTVPWYSVAHPGLLTGRADEVAIDPGRRTVAGWNFLHARWAAARRRG